MGIQAQVSFFMLIGLSLLLVWMADRKKDSPDVQKVLEPMDAYDSDWLSSCIDHAINQMVFLLYFVLVLLTLFINPKMIVSLGHHQPLGNCLENELFCSLMGIKHHRKKYLCVHDFDEEFNLCNSPITQLLYEDSWYMICGREYKNTATYMALIVGSFFGLNLLIFQILKWPQCTQAVFFHYQ
ncbi:unnamed protein product [Peronospora destructor]|uniref:DUF7802 domain-containing protein n=1 Tax=Peronospora destructor TaxID=86335 RepID=A0AAV0V1X1_9STRA|nr:unnamed protein product [Peronospora destructor]